MSLSKRLIQVIQEKLCRILFDRPTGSRTELKISFFSLQEEILATEKEKVLERG